MRRDCAEAKLKVIPARRLNAIIRTKMDRAELESFMKSPAKYWREGRTRCPADALTFYETTNEMPATRMAFAKLSRRCAPRLGFNHYVVGSGVVVEITIIYA